MSERITASLLTLAFAGFLFFALKSGVVGVFGGAAVDRSKSPVIYWVGVIAILFAALLSLAVVVGVI